jgi:hypothetical protein
MDKLLFLSVCWIWGQAVTWIQYTMSQDYKYYLPGSTWGTCSRKSNGTFFYERVYHVISKLWCRCFDEIISFRRNHFDISFRVLLFRGNLWLRICTSTTNSFNFNVLLKMHWSPWLISQDSSTPNHFFCNLVLIHSLQRLSKCCTKSTDMHQTNWRENLVPGGKKKI